MVWPFRKSFDALLRDTAVLDAQLAVPTTRASVDLFLATLAAQGLEATPENLVDAAIRAGASRDGALLLAALVARLQGAS